MVIKHQFGPQPVLELMHEHRWTINGLARTIGVDRQHLGRAINGRIHPSPRLRKVLPEIFNRPLEQLFTESALDVPLVQVGRYVLMMNESADLVKPAKTGTALEASMEKA
jgi:DNA-binding XRE family transcriptional regulator